MLDSLREWLVDWADSPAGPVMLAVLTAAEAITFPIPPDPLLIALALRHPESALLLAALTTAASVAGGLVGHWLGLRFGRPLLRRFHSKQLDRVEAMFVRNGFWAIFLAGLTPLPYKIFTISAGVFGIPRMPFLLASIVGRGPALLPDRRADLRVGRRVSAVPRRTVRHDHARDGRAADRGPRRLGALGAARRSPAGREWRRRQLRVRRGGGGASAWPAAGGLAIAYDCGRPLMAKRRGRW